MTPGKKIAKPSSCRFIESSKGTMGFEVTFQTSEGTIDWTGWLTPNAMERTVDTMVHVLGFSGNDEVRQDGTLVDTNALNWDQQVELVVAMEDYQGKSYPRVKWINRMGGFAGCAPETVKTKLDLVGFSAAVLLSRQNQATAPIQKLAPTVEIPF